MLEKQNQGLEAAKFKVERDITPEDKIEINEGLHILHKNAVISGDPDWWGNYATYSMYKKFLFPEENDPKLRTRTYQGLEKTRQEFFEKGDIDAYLQVTASKKILFPREWAYTSEGQEFHSGDKLWKIFAEHLEYLGQDDDWFHSEKKLLFFESAKNMKIISPKKFKTLNLQNMLRKDIWVEDIKTDLERNFYDYQHFLCLANPMHILEYPGTIELEPLEWLEIQEEARRIKGEEDILAFTAFCAMSNILASKEVKITEDSFDLIF